MFEVLKNRLLRLLAFLWRWIGISLVTGILGVLLISRVIDWLVGPDYYSVYLVGGSEDLDDSLAQKIWDGFHQQALELDGIKIKLQKVDAGENEAESVSKKLAEQDDTLMVVGHLYSTASQKALPFYIREAKPPVPVILPTETSPHLLPPLPSDAYMPVFRLAPTDQKQAEKAADFAVRHGAKSIWVVEDVSNPTYSRYLAKEFINQVHEQKKSKVLLWTTNRGIPSADAVNALGIDWVFFAGHWTNGLILTRQVRSIKGARIPILLSDWCADQALIDKGGADMREVYVTHPMQASEFYREGYALVGRMAYQLVQQLTESANTRFNELAARNSRLTYYVNRILGIHRVGDARNALRSLMEERVNLEKSFYLGKQVYKFKRNGVGIETPFHVWQVRTAEGGDKFTEDKFTDVE